MLKFLNSMKTHEVIITALACVLIAAMVGVLYYAYEAYKCKQKAEKMKKRTYRHEHEAPKASLRRTVAVALITALALETAFFIPFTVAKIKENKSSGTHGDKPPVSIGTDEYSITYYEELDPDLAKKNDTVAEWLDKCVNDDERDDIGNYILFYKDTSGDKTVYTYIIYRTLLENDCSVKFYMNEEEYIITAEYTSLTTSKRKTHLSMVQVTADEEPADIDLIENGDYLGALFTTEYTDIADFLE